jgi:hypothetical protein
LIEHPRLARWLARIPLALFLLATAVVWAHLNQVFIELLPAPIPSPDAGSYLIWSVFRTVGYPAFLDGYHRLFGTWVYLPLVQLNFLLAGLFALTFAVAQVTRSYLIAWLIPAFAVGAAGMLVSAADMLTEATFAAFVMGHVAFVILFLDRRRWYFALGAGLCLTLVILIKSVAVVLLGPLFAFIVFLKGSRRALAALVVAPAMLAWLVPSAANLARNGFFESSAAGGFALSGHVAWAIHPRPGSPVAEDALAIEKRLQPVLAKRPRQYNSWREYVDYTAAEYNTLLWVHVVPEVMGRRPKICAVTWSCGWSVPCPGECMVTTNRTLMTLAREAIAGSPIPYAAHVSAHTRGLWRDVFEPVAPNLVHAVAGRGASVHGAYNPAENGFHELLGPFRPFPSAEETGRRAEQLLQGRLARFVDELTLGDFGKDMAKYFRRNPLGPLITALVASLLVFRLPSLWPAAQALCYCALVLNAYFIGTALAQPSLSRYSFPMQAVVAAQICLIVGLVVLGALHPLLRRRAKAANAPQART